MGGIILHPRFVISHPDCGATVSARTDSVPQPKLYLQSNEKISKYARCSVHNTDPHNTNLNSKKSKKIKTPQS